MISIEPVIRNFKSNGFAQVYIRVIHHGKPAYIPTHFTATRKQADGHRITDYSLIVDIAPTIKEYYTKLNTIHTTNMTVNEVVEFLKSDGAEISFTSWCDKYINEMIRAGRENSSDNYRTAINSLIKFTGKEQLYFSDITSKIISRWIKDLNHTARAKNSYPNAIKAMFIAGTLEYNDYDRGILKIKNQPFINVDIPETSPAEKRAISANELRRFFKADISKAKRIKTAPMAADVAKIVFFLAAINTADLYYMDKKCLKKNVLTYYRHKTATSRKDKAKMIIHVPDEIMPLFQKYKGTERLFNFSEQYRVNDDFNKAINKGMKELSEIAGIDKITTYYLRHTWGTLAQNKCGASTELVGFCLNHASAHKTTEGYIEKDYTPVDILNRKVIDYVFDRRFHISKFSYRRKTK